MLSYRHIYHAGNFADVVKHVTLVALLQALLRKESACYVHDSHAGCGVYDLESPEAVRARECDSGIGRVWQQHDAPAPIQAYQEILREYNPGLAAPRYYPGSPAITRSLLREQDRLLLTELHPHDHALLLERFRGDKRIHIHKQDAYQGLKAFLPPLQKRGLVLIDPPYELKDEYERVVTALTSAYARWRQGIFAIWYPIMSRGLQSRLLDGFTATGIRKQLHVQFQIASFASQKQFVGCGLVLVNPPWQLDIQLAECLHWLVAPLRQTVEPLVRIEWLVEE